MTVGAGITLSNGDFTVLGNPVLSDVHTNITVSPAPGGGVMNGAFIGVKSDQTGCRRVFPVGKLMYVCSFCSCN